MSGSVFGNVQRESPLTKKKRSGQIAESCKKEALEKKA